MTNKIGVTRKNRFMWLELTAFLDDRVDTTCLAVLSSIATFANGDRVAFPSYELIAKRAKCHKTTAKKKVKELVSFGYLKKVSRRKENSKENDSNIYEILDPAFLESFPHGSTEIPGGSTELRRGSPELPEVVAQGDCNNTNITIPNNNIYTSASANKKIKVPINHKKGDK